MCFRYPNSCVPRASLGRAKWACRVGAALSAACQRQGCSQSKSQSSLPKHPRLSQECFGRGLADHWQTIGRVWPQNTWGGGRSKSVFSSTLSQKNTWEGGALRRPFSAHVCQLSANGVSLAGGVGRIGRFGQGMAGHWQGIGRALAGFGRALAGHLQGIGRALAEPWHLVLRQT